MSTPTSAIRVPARFRARGVVSMTGLVVATLGATLPQAMTAPVVGITADAFGVTTVDATWALTITLVVAVATTPLIGRMGDAYGARRMLLIVLPMVASGLFVSAIAPTFGWLITGRAILGVGGGVFPLAIAAVPGLVPARSRAGAVGLVTAMFATGIGFGVLVSGLLVDHIGIRATAWAPFGIVVAGWIILASTLPHIPRRSNVHVELRAALSLAVGVIAVLLAFTEAPRWPSPWWWITGLALIATGSLYYWFLRERVSPDPLIGAPTLRLRGVWATQLTAFLLGVTLLGIYVLIPAFAESPGDDEVGLSASVTLAALLLLPATVAMLVVGPLSGVLRRWIGTRAPVILGAATAAAGALVMIIAPRELATLLVGTILLGAGIAAASAGLVNVLIDHVDEQHVGAATGLTVVARQLGGAVGASMIAGLIAIQPSEPDGDVYGAAFAAVTVVTVLALLSTLLIPAGTSSTLRRVRHRISR
ncbi:MFS transporter [Microbacterium sp. NPDC076911]|uniref:MFS transporter n=1 Tax=Microbacterium sp. NPDC076911 TaxID=3154958 RepID=UPI003431C91F